MTPETLITLTSARTLQRMDVPGTGKPFWTVREAGIACSGLEPEIFAAMLYSYAGADECYYQLFDSLCGWARDMRHEEGWPLTVRREDRQRTKRDYIDELVGLSLIEEREPRRFGGAEGSVVAPMYLAVMNVKGSVWMKLLAHPYACLRWRYITWLGIGRSHMRNRMRLFSATH